MAIQGYSTGGGGRFYAYPVIKDTTTPATPFWRIAQTTDTTITKKAYGVISRAADEVGVISCASSFDANPQTMVLTGDRSDSATEDFFLDFTLALREGYYTSAAAAATTAKQYEDGIQVRSTDTTTEPIPDEYKLFIIWVGPQVKDAATGAYKRLFEFCLANLADSSPNFTTAYMTDNQFSYTFNALSEDLPFTVEDIAELFQPTNIENLTAVDNHETGNVAADSWQAQFQALTPAQLSFTAKTGIRRVYA